MHNVILIIVSSKWSSSFFPELFRRNKFLAACCSSFQPIISELFILSFQLSFSKSYRCIVQISSNQFMISSFSGSKMPPSIFIRFSYSSRWIVPLLCSFSIIMVVLSRFFFFDYHINSFVLSNPTGGSWRLLQVLCYIPSQSFSRRISSMPNPLLVINLNWWRIRIP